MLQAAFNTYHFFQPCFNSSALQGFLNLTSEGTGPTRQTSLEQEVQNLGATEKDLTDTHQMGRVTCLKQN